VTDHDLHTLAGAYVLDAVSEQERARFARHLASCAECRQDVRELREATARLGTASAIRPRPELRAPTIRAASKISQAGPVIADQAASGDAGRHSVPASSRMRLWPARRGPALLLTLAAAAVVISGAVGLALAPGSAPGKDHMITSVLKAPDAVLLTAKVSAGGMATVVISHHEHMGVFMAHDLPALPGAERYELWLMGPAGTRPAGLLRAGHGGMAGPVLVARMRPGDMIGLTIEPASGSLRPTSAPLVLIGQKSGP
jgi:anti-sigma-K factor RskA